MDSATLGSFTSPVNSEDFLPPAACRHKRGDMDVVKAQQADRERMVCAIGLDVHYELNVLSGETGSYQPRLRPFNPRMSGPACPYNYTGKFIGEDAISYACDDPIELGRKIHAAQPYDTALYRKYDPRRVSKTVVIRDYGCKVPIRLADTAAIAEAVLNNYPDRYVHFLREFVSNIMGEAMKAYLKTYRDGLEKLLKNPTEMNRVSWGAYKSVQGGHTPHLKSGDSETTTDQVWCTDSTLLWEDNIARALDTVVLTKGDTMTGTLTAQDVFDTTPCLKQHIHTLDEMSSAWCQGFATKERYALALLWWCNEQGRNLSQDLALLKGDNHPNYNLIELHVPINPFHADDLDKPPPRLSPDQNCAIRGDLGEPSAETVRQTVAYRVPVGQWTGNNETPNVLVHTSKSPFSWGWGHPANLTVNVEIQDTTKAPRGYIRCAPYLRYDVGDNEWKQKPVQVSATVAAGSRAPKYSQGLVKVYQNYPCATEFVRTERWGEAFTGTAHTVVQKPLDKEIIASAKPVRGGKLRDSLTDDASDVNSVPPSFYRGAPSEPDRTFGSMLQLTDSTPRWVITRPFSYTSDTARMAYLRTRDAGKLEANIRCKTDPRHHETIPLDGNACGPDGESIVHVLFSGLCRQIDPFFSNGPNCLVTSVPDAVSDDPPSNVLIKAKCFSYYDISQLRHSDAFKSIMRRAVESARRYASACGSRNAPTADLGVYMNSYADGHYYAYRLLVPSLSLTGSHATSLLPFAELYTNEAMQHKQFVSQFDLDELEVGASAFAAKHTIMNQHFVSSFTVNMNNVKWKMTNEGGPGGRGYTDLTMSDVREQDGIFFMRSAMRIIAIRTVLSVLLGMDTAALICEEPIPTHRIVAFVDKITLPSGAPSESSKYNDFACSPLTFKGCMRSDQLNHFYNGSSGPGYRHPINNNLTRKSGTTARVDDPLQYADGTALDAPPHFTERKVPKVTAQSMNATVDPYNTWKDQFWKNTYKDIQIDNRNLQFKVSQNADPISNEMMQLAIIHHMLIVITTRLKLFLDSVRTQDAREKKVICTNLFRVTQPHMLRMAIVARFASPKHVAKLERSATTIDYTSCAHYLALQDIYDDARGLTTAEATAAAGRLLLDITSGTSAMPPIATITRQELTQSYDHYATLREKTSIDFHKRVFASMNCAVRRSPDLTDDAANNPELDEFPYDVAFQTHVGSTSCHKFVQMYPPNNSTATNHFDFLTLTNVERHAADHNTPHLKMIESLIRDPRNMYAKNAKEWYAQWKNHEKEYGEDILEGLAGLSAGLFTLPYFDTDDKTHKDLKLTHPCLPQDSAAACLLAYFEYGSTPPASTDYAINNPDFETQSILYIEALAKHAAEVLSKKTHYFPVMDSLDPGEEERPRRGTEREYGAVLPTPSVSGEIKNDIPIAMLMLTAGISSGSLPGDFNGLPTYFPALPTNNTSLPRELVDTNIAATNIDPVTAVTPQQRSLIPVAGPTVLSQKINNVDQVKRFTLLPVGKHVGYTNFDTYVEKNKYLTYNVDVTRPQMFAMLDAAGLLWHARAYVNPSDCNRPIVTEAPQCDGMHYWCRTLVETFVSAREIYRQREPTSMWELDVKRIPGHALPSKMIGNLCDDTWASYFPLLPHSHELRDDLRRCRALSVLWGNLTQYTSGEDTSGGASGAWMPLAPAHQMRLYNSVGLFDEKYRVPTNPWLPRNGTGIGLVFNQSYHSVYHCDNYRASHFQDWLENANRYQVPFVDEGGCSYPFSQYGGTPVEADFVPHIVEKCTDRAKQKRHKQLVYNRFGFTSALRIGNQYHDTGLLQDMFQYEYRPYAHLTMEQRSMKCDRVHISNFLSYARTHAIIALASCNHGTEDESVPRIVRNLYRLYVDTYECMGSNTDDDGVPCIMGFNPAPVNKREDRGVVLYAGSLACLNSKLSAFCNSDLNRGEKVCAIYKQVYLNDATLLYTRLLRQERRKILHDNNFTRARMKRGDKYRRSDFDRELVELQDAYIEFLQSTVLGMLLEGGADLNGAPLHLLEPRELEVSLFQEDDNLVGNDFLTPRTKEIIAQSDFSGDNLTRSQLAILSLIPPNHRVLGTLRLNQSMEVVDLEHAKKQIQKETMESNKKVWQRYSDGLISAAFAQKLLEVDGPIDFAFDMSSIQDPMRFDMSAFKDPLKESENIRSRMTTTHAQSSSSLSLGQRGDKLRKSTTSDSVLNMNTKELNRALEVVRNRVERDYALHKGTKSRVQVLNTLRIPSHVKQMMTREYERGGLA